MTLEFPYWMIGWMDGGIHSIKEEQLEGGQHRQSSIS